METKKKSRSQVEADWVRRNVRRFMAAFSDLTDADIIERLESQENKQGYIKQLIREDIARERKDPS